MTLQMNYQEKYEQGVEQEKRQSALRMIEAGKLSLEEIALYSGLTIEQVFELEKRITTSIDMCIFGIRDIY